MNYVRVKICGITNPEDLHLAVEAGADAVGFVVNVPKSTRNLSLKEAKQLVKATPPFVDTVAVTVFKQLEDLEEIRDTVNPSTLQIHNAVGRIREIRERFSDVCLIGAFKAENDLDLNSLMKISESSDAVLIDTYIPGKHGGTGIVHDWNLSKQVKQVIHPKSLILAGGLNTENVRDAISIVQPYAIDVSTGVESHPGKKDSEKVKAFIENAKTTIGRREGIRGSTQEV